MPTAMVLNIYALIGFLLLLSADFLAAFGKKQVAGLPKAAGYCLVTLAFGLLALAPPPQPVSAPPIDAILILPGIVIAALSAYFLFRTVFLELAHSGALVKSGSYGLCRHPGFWWFGLLALDLAALRGFGPFLGYAILLIALNFILILVQDVYLFPKIFDGYDDYRKSVPFLFPRKRATRCGGE